MEENSDPNLHIDNHDEMKHTPHHHRHHKHKQDNLKVPLGKIDRKSFKKSSIFNEHEENLSFMEAHEMDNQLPEIANQQSNIKKHPDDSLAPKEIVPKDAEPMLNLRKVDEPIPGNLLMSAAPQFAPEMGNTTYRPNETTIMHDTTRREFLPKKKKSKKGKKNDKVSFRSLYRYRTKLDTFLIIVGSIAAFLNGASFPAFSVLFGIFLGSFGTNPQASLDETTYIAKILVSIGAGMFVLGWVFNSFWIAVGARMARRLRHEYLDAILKQDITWFDTMNPQELPSRITSQMTLIENGIGERVGFLIYAFSMWFCGIVVGITRGYALTLIILAVVPLTIITGFVLSKIVKKSTERNQKAYSKAGGLSEQAISGIRTVASFNGGRIEIGKYDKSIDLAKKAGIIGGVSLGIGLGVFFWLTYSTYAYGFYISSWLLEQKVYNSNTHEPYTPGIVFTVFFGVIFGLMAIGQLTPHFKAIQEAKTAGKDVFEIIDRPKAPQYTQDPTKVLKIDERDFKGRIEFKNITFAYPTRPDNLILKNFSMVFEEGKTTAIVGHSGSGKSTSIQLIERFYDPNEGSITIDGYDLKDIDLKWFRQNVGYVGQEPVLFNRTIKENLLYGNEIATDQDLMEACKMANAWEFIAKLKDGLDTKVGVSGSQFSGGQKQRLAIARSIVKKPKILLLDEATSALDRISEKEVQNALDEVSKGITTIVIAHRLTTIMGADKIIMVHNGNLLEAGTHEELMEKKGGYYELVKNQLPNSNNQDGQDDSGRHSNMTPSVRSSRTSQISRENSVLSEALMAQPGSLGFAMGMPGRTLVLPDGKKGVLARKIYKETKEGKKYLYLGFFFSCIEGAVFPGYAIAFQHIIFAFVSPDMDYLRKEADLVCLMIFVIAWISFFASALRASCFAIAGEILTRNLRHNLFETMMRKEVGWFDLPENSVGALNYVLASDTAIINMASTQAAGTILTMITAIILAIILGFIFAWTITLIGLLCIPFILLGGYLIATRTTNSGKKMDLAYQDSINVLSEAVLNFRTVASFANEGKVLKIFDDALEEPYQESLKDSVKNGAINGVSSFLTFAVWALLFYSAISFWAVWGYDLQGITLAMFIVIISANGAGRSQEHTADIARASKSADSVFKITDSGSLCDPFSDAGQKPDPETFHGAIEFKNVWFKYPTRTDWVLSNFNLKIEAGKSVAFVGPSGSGKSTICQLLQRFYDVNRGELLIDGINIKDYNLKYLRDRVGIVFQEPTLFDMTIKENISYGQENVTDEAVKEAARVANALNFIESDDLDQPTLPTQQVQVKPKKKKKMMKRMNEIDEALAEEKHYGKGFERRVGTKGSQMSGGQKQRIAIARAVLKNPKILLLDEATSALDKKSEEDVQAALDKVSKGRTTVAIAHRLSTIQDCDCIYVLQAGSIAESGTYKHLMKKKAVFYNLAAGTVPT